MPFNGCLASRKQYNKTSPTFRSGNMRKSCRAAFFVSALFLLSAAATYAADSKAGTLTCVGLYSETSDGYVSFRSAGKTDWTVMKVGDVIPANGDIKINVSRDWVELISTNNPNLVYELDGPDSGEMIKTVADVVKGKGRTVAFPKGTATAPDPKFKDKLVVKQYLGRQIYINKDGDSEDIKYGMVLDRTGKVKIIATNNTISLMNASAAITSVVGPLKFEINDVLSNKNLYKFLNVQK